MGTDGYAAGNRGVHCVSVILSLSGEGITLSGTGAAAGCSATVLPGSVDAGRISPTPALSGRDR